jgi:hypothetical protein
LDASHDKSLSSDLLHERWCKQKKFTVVNEVKQNNEPETIITPPILWLQHKELGKKMEQFSNVLMHMLFIGVTKHLMAHVDRLFGNKNSNFQKFCGIILKHIKFRKDISLEWCPVADFSEAESISTTGWQSAQYVAFSRLLLVYFGLLEDFKNNFDETKFKTF